MTDLARIAAERFITKVDPSGRNWIETQMTPDRRHVELRLYIDGERNGWIQFDATQWDNVVRDMLTQQGRFDRS